jgi:hypothetical protein
MIKTEETDYSRDLTSRALINTNVKALNDYRLKRNQSKKIETIEEDLSNLRNMMIEIKEMLQVLKIGK